MVFCKRTGKVCSGQNQEEEINMTYKEAKKIRKSIINKKGRFDFNQKKKNETYLMTGIGLVEVKELGRLREAIDVIHDHEKEKK